VAGENLTAGSLTVLPTVRFWPGVDTDKLKRLSANRLRLVEDQPNSDGLNSSMKGGAGEGLARGASACDSLLT
jgi:hypothetical protein